MNYFDLKGTKIIYGSQKGVILTVLEDEPHIVLIRYENEKLGEIDYEDFLTLHSNGVIRLLKQCNKAVNGFRISKKHMKEMEMREAYILPMLRHEKCHSPNIRKQIVTSVFATRNDLKRPGDSTVSRWVRDYLEHDCDIRKQVLGKKGRGTGLTPEMESLIEKVTIKHYLKREGLNKRGTWEKFVAVCKRMGYDYIPPERTFTRRLEKICPKLKKEKRKGISEARKEFRLVTNVRDHLQFGEEYQIDTAHFNLGIIEYYLDRVYFIGTVSINFVFEPTTGSIPGYSIQIGQKGEQSGFVVNALTHAMSIKYDPNFVQSGIPRRILMDAGAGYIAQSTRSFLEAAGCEFDVTPTRSPWLKGAVERLIRHVRDNFFRGIKGYLGKYNPDEYTDISVKKAAHLTIEKFRVMFANFVKEYHNTPLDRLNGLTPNQAWKKGFRSNPLMDIDDIPELRKYKGELVKGRVLNKNQGVFHLGNWFNSPELQHLYLKMHKSRKFKEYKVDFLVDPLNADDVSVIVPSVISGDPLNIELITANNTRHVNGKSFSQLRAADKGVEILDGATVFVSDESEWTTYRAPRKTGNLIDINADPVTPEEAEIELEIMVGANTYQQPTKKQVEVSNKDNSPAKSEEPLNAVDKHTNNDGVKKLW